MFLVENIHYVAYVFIITDPPSILYLPKQDINETSDFSIVCNATPGNPNKTTFYWTRQNDPVFKRNGSILHIPNIQRNSSGTYSCTAKNSYNNTEMGIDTKNLIVNVLCELIFPNK